MEWNTYTTLHKSPYINIRAREGCTTTKSLLRRIHRSMDSFLNFNRISEPVGACPYSQLNILYNIQTWPHYRYFLNSTIPGPILSVYNFMYIADKLHIRWAFLRCIDNYNRMKTDLMKSFCWYSQPAKNIAFLGYKGMPLMAWKYGKATAVVLDRPFGVIKIASSVISAITVIILAW